MIWNTAFENRLRAWQQLRDRCRRQSVPEALAAINQWWYQTPWTPYLLHWDDRSDWPDPWQLLENHRFCSVARGLGILYTVAMLERRDLIDAELVEAGDDNLVLICDQKYILNWDREQIVNINLGSINPRRRIKQHEIAVNFL